MNKKVLLGIILVFAVGGIIFVSRQSTTTTPANPVPLTPTMPSVENCMHEDPSFCATEQTVKTLIESNQFEDLEAYLTPSETECLPDLNIPISVCEGVTQKETRMGYLLGRMYSEGDVQPLDMYLTTFSQSYNNMGPFIYTGSVQEGNKAAMVFLNADKTEMFAPMLKEVDDSWKISLLLTGMTNEEFKTLNPSVLQMIQN